MKYTKIFHELSIIIVGLIFLISCTKNADDKAQTLAIGDSKEGGKVAYILQVGDPDYDAATPHGLIVATEDQSKFIAWAKITSNLSAVNPITGAIGFKLGTGLYNTNKIVASLGAPTASYAAGLARTYTGGGYSDWYLPSKDELNKLYLNRKAIGGFADEYYWSSTESGRDDATAQNLTNGSQFVNPRKNYKYYVRAVRAF